MGTSKSTIKRNLYEWKHRVSKTMVTIENKKARLDVARKHKKKKKKDSGGEKNGHMKSSHLMPAQQTMIFSY